MKQSKISSKQLFAAANSGRGFANFYPQVFDLESIERRYLIKGGPGTGKSTFMKKISAKAHEAGYDVEYYRCSSDPDSLDGVIIGGRIALMDATSPHCVDASLAGARDNIVDLGAFWNSDGLYESIAQIKELSDIKSSSYGTAYSFLTSAMTLEDRARALVGGYVNREKMKKAVTRLAKKLPLGGGYQLKAGICGSIGMKGKTRLDTYEQMADTVYYLLDAWHSGSDFLAMLAGEAVKRDCRLSVSYAPLNPDYIDALYFEQSKTAFVLCDKKAGEETKYDDKKCVYINMKRFINFCGEKQGKKRIKSVKSEYRTAIRFSEALVDSATEALKRAGDAHFELEQIYVKNMDFAAQSRFTADFAEKILRELK